MMKVLPPDEAKRKARANLAAWKGMKDRQETLARKDALRKADEPVPEQPPAEPAGTVNKTPVQVEKERLRKERIRKEYEQSVMAVEYLLIDAIQKGQIERAEKAVDKLGPNRRIHGTTALHMACQEGNLRIVRMLIRKGAEVDAVNGDGHTPLAETAHHGHKRIARELISNGADVNAVDGRNWSVLDWAIMGKRLDMVKLLVKNGADPSSDLLLIGSMSGVKMDRGMNRITRYLSKHRR